MIYDFARPRHVEIFTRCVFLLLAFDLAIDPIEQAAALPLDWFSPVGVWKWLPHNLLGRLYDSTVLGALRISSLLGLGCAAFVVPARRFVALPSCFLAIVCASFGRGLGHINHAQLPLLFIACFLGVVWTLPWDHESRSELDAAKSSALLSAVALLMSFFYAGIGLYRLGQSGIDAYLGDAMRYYAASNYLRAGNWSFDYGRLILESDAALVLVNLGYAVVTVGEISAPWAHRKRLFALGWSVTMIGFHVMVFLTMNILFFHNVILLVLLYLWPLTWKVERPHAAGAAHQAQAL